MFIRVINRFFKLFRYRVIPLTVFTLACEALHRRGNCITFIQVGANDGVRYDDLFQKVTGGGWKGLVIEPIPETFERLAMNYRHNQNVIPLNFAIHPDKSSEKVFYVSPDALMLYPDYAYGLGSMMRGHLVKHGINDSDISVVDVPCRTLSKVIAEHDLHDLDVLQIDTEGFDYEVIKTLDFEASKPLIVKFEWMNLSAEEKQAARQLLLGHGYNVFVERGGADCVAILAGSLNL